ncbi:HAD-IA family hydrolase [Desulfomicrobium sp. ZS1]|uniref:HAD-IA family hydrolase n=1 Tax=Desulfomicrobium sp. ZS1 TaxID=2952228 RepID=UPI0020B38B80|nr:HAD-IA family hydrolase [Desulfomicrobium sp. ZS1]UTF51201.1 HAD-IA family hydrolase [Desulfomicrobium sp. ZS1]
MYSQFINILYKSEIISFDIFDTLISRPLFSPFDTFDHIADLFFERHGKQLLGFKKIRIHCEDSCRKNALVNEKRQDVTLDEIYIYIASIYKLSNEESKSLLNIEKYVEKKLLIPRQSGKILYKLASIYYKDIILVSDMYLDREFISNLMTEYEFDNFIEFYLSSEVGLRKREGDLFKYVLSKTKCPAEKLLHIGDNAVGDISIPKSLGINTFQTPRAIELMASQSDNWRTVCESSKKSRTFSQSLSLGLVAQKLFDNQYDLPQKNTDFGGCPFAFGYAAFGPAVVGFASWLNRMVKSDMINHLVFLSRDGKIVKDIFDLLYHNCNVSTNYFYASRRALRVAGIKNDADIINITLSPIYSTTIQDFFKDKFGLDSEYIDTEILQNHNLSGLDANIGAKFSRETLLSIVLFHKKLIFERAIAERNSLIDAFSSMGLTGKTAIVDIGYAGTMQNYFINLLNKEINGYYFATFNTIEESSAVKNSSKGYVIDVGHPNCTKSGICTHRFLYETIFCDADNSFICYEHDNLDNIITVKNLDHDDIKRQYLVLDIHAGAKVFAADILAACKNEMPFFYLPPDFATYQLDLFFKNPHPVDALMFEGVLFEDSAGPKTLRYIVPPLNLLTNGSIQKNIVWNQGSIAAKKAVIAMKKKKNRINFKEEKPNHVEVQTNRIGVIRKFESFIIRQFTSDKLYAKYLRNRHEYFLDSKHRLLKIYFNITG